jgi:ABC-2 type transport system ATP-binding protein
MLTGLLKPTSGDVLILGQSIDQDPMAVKASIGLVPDDLPLFDRLTGEETLLFIGRIHGLARGGEGAAKNSSTTSISPRREPRR